MFAALAFVVLTIGAGLAAAGAWLVLPFAWLEVLLRGLKQKDLELGRHLDAATRVAFAAELKKRLRI